MTNKKRKLIGIPANELTQQVEHFGSPEISYIPKTFAEALQKEGALPILLPIDHTRRTLELLKQLDGLLFIGGQDVTPAYYEEEPLPLLQQTNPDRDAFEISLFQAAWKQNLPILAVCRGMQLANVALGGSLYQDLSYYKNWNVKHVQIPTGSNYSTHSVNIDKHSRLFSITGEHLMVNSYHHQAIKRLSPELKIVAESTDKIVEAVEPIRPEQRFLGVQWHPELNFTLDPIQRDLFHFFVHEL